MTTLALFPLLMVSAVMLAPAMLQLQIEAFSGQPAQVDPRLLLPACAKPDFAWAAGGRSVVVHCAAPEWRVFVPVGERGAPPSAQLFEAVPAQAAQPAVVPAIRRGDRVSLEIGGAGFVVAMDTVADSDASNGRVPLRATTGGRRLYGAIDDDGHVRLHGLSKMVNGR